MTPSAYDPAIAMSGQGEAVVLVPGMDGTGLLFYRQVPLLARSYRVATYALRDATASMETLVDDLSHVIDTVAPIERKVIVVGESFGGALALSFALARPGQVRALVILNSFPYFAPQFRLHLARVGLGLLPWGAMGLIRELTATRLHSPHTHRDEIHRFMQLTKRTTRRGYLNRLRALTRYDVRDRLSSITAPTLFLASDCDHLVPSVREARYMAARVPRAVLHVLGGHGHICLIAPDVDLEQLIRSWEVSRASR